MGYVVCMLAIQYIVWNTSFDYKKLVSKYLKLVVQWCTEHTSKTHLMSVCT